MGVRMAMAAGVIKGVRLITIRSFKTIIRPSNKCLNHSTSHTPTPIWCLGRAWDSKRHKDRWRQCLPLMHRLLLSWVWQYRIPTHRTIWITIGIQLRQLQVKRAHSRINSNSKCSLRATTCLRLRAIQAMASYLRTNPIWLVSNSLVRGLNWAWTSIVTRSRHPAIKESTRVAAPWI